MDNTQPTTDKKIDKLAAALVAFQAELSPVDKTAANPFFKSKYAPHPEIRKALQPILAKHKLAVIDVPEVIDGKNGLRFYLIHESGQYLDGVWLLTPAKHDPQGEGSDVTYKRRYGEMAMTGLVADEDDDGNAASARGYQPAKRSVLKPSYQPSRSNLANAEQKMMISNLLSQRGIETPNQKDYMYSNYGDMVSSMSELDAQNIIEDLDADRKAANK